MSMKADILKAIHENRNQQVLNELYVKVLPKVRGYVLGNSGNNEDAQDIFQDAVISFFHAVKTGKFDESKDIDAFIYVVAKNAWINKVRKDKNLVIKEEIPESKNMNGLNQLDILITKEREQTFKKVFYQLSEQCIELMKLSIYEDLPPRKIMTLLGLSSIDVTRTNIYRCRKKLTELVLTNKRDLTIS